MTIYRQGDVLIRRIDAMPEGAKAKKWDGDVILAYGEVTGHAHRIADKTVTEFTDADKRFLKVVGVGATLTHEEHAAIKIEPGVYEVIQQREYVPGMVPNVVQD